MLPHIQVEDEFSVGAVPGGDLDQNGTLHRFFGKLDSQACDDLA